MDVRKMQPGQLAHGDSLFTVNYCASTTLSIVAQSKCVKCNPVFALGRVVRLSFAITNRCTDAARCLLGMGFFVEFYILQGGACHPTLNLYWVLMHTTG
jgi:hypothetical protein